jgi:triphosphoribosyl-dephospho-CoA synthase
MTTGQLATLACLLEAMASKPGNVHRGADFEDLTFADLALSAVAIGPAFDKAESYGVGMLAVSAITETRQVVKTNSNLGMVLLMAPLAVVSSWDDLARGVRDVLQRLTADDAAAVYLAIRKANPGGMGKVEQADVHDAPPPSLLDAMRLAADRDLVARQYANGFHEVLNKVVPSLEAGIARRWALNDVIIRTYLELMRDEPDSLIARKCGKAVAEQAAMHAGQVLRAGEPGDENYNEALADLDFWLRADGHRRNPGTTADLVAAGLFAALREHKIEWPMKFY